MISYFRRLAAAFKLVSRQEFSLPNRPPRWNQPASLSEMQSAFDRAWEMLQTTGAVSPDSFTPQRQELWGIVMKLMRDGQSGNSTLAQDAVDEFISAQRRAD